MEEKKEGEQVSSVDFALSFCIRHANCCDLFTGDERRAQKRDVKSTHNYAALIRNTGSSAANVTIVGANINICKIPPICMLIGTISVKWIKNVSGISDDILTLNRVLESSFNVVIAIKCITKNGVWMNHHQ